MNRAVEPTTLYQPVAHLLLSRFAGGPVRRMLPAMGCSPFTEQRALLSQVAALVPPSVEVTLLADRQYGTAAVTRGCPSQGRHFCLRALRQ